MEDTYNKAGFITFMFALILNILFFVYVSFIHEGVNGIDTIGKQTIDLTVPAKEESQPPAKEENTGK
ncbi:MAG: hypothetical protein KDK36_06465 [Leptospiraceae bacterium]|nr:hypothetical protein [Leptospiraceae bacterium]